MGGRLRSADALREAGGDRHERGSRRGGPDEAQAPAFPPFAEPDPSDLPARAQHGRLLRGEVQEVRERRAEERERRGGADPRAGQLGPREERAAGQGADGAQEEEGEPQEEEAAERQERQEEEACRRQRPRQQRTKEE